MRDYILNPSQTNLELYEQLKQSMFYKTEDILAVHKAYFFALSKVKSLYRGSGKPFICHLVGTCSILATLNLPVNELVAALLHALYQNRVEFDGESSISNRRKLIAKEFGNEVDELIAAYNEFEMIHLSDIDIKKTDSKVVKMRLADTLEDFTGQALYFRGHPDDAQEIKGSFLNYLNFYKNNGAILIQLANDVDAPNIAEAFQHWLFDVSYNDFPASMRMGYYSSFNI